MLITTTSLFYFVFLKYRVGAGAALRKVAPALNSKRPKIRLRRRFYVKCMVIKKKIKLVGVNGLFSAGATA